MSACTDSHATKRQSCGQTFGGELQHCVARVPWSQYPDGRAHLTASLSAIDYLWRKGGDTLANPAEHGFTQDERGRWRSPADPEVTATLWGAA